MSKNKTVNEFLDETVRTYGFTPISDVKRRELRFKLGLADIKDTISPEDTSLALDIVLEELVPIKSGALKTASAHGALQPCPRCQSVMSSVKLSNTCDALYCSSCHVTVPKK